MKLRYYWVETEAGYEIAAKSYTGRWSLFGINPKEDVDHEILNVLYEIKREQIDNHEPCALGSVVGQSEQLLAFKEWERDKCRLPWDAEPKEIIEQYLS